MTQMSVAQRQNFRGVKISDSLTVSPGLVQGINEMLSVGIDDAVIVSSRGVLRTVGEKIFCLSTQPPLAGGVATNPCGDVAIVQTDGQVLLVDQVGTTQAFTLPRNPADLSFDGGVQMAPLEGRVSVAMDITGEQIAVAVQNDITVFNRRGKVIARYELWAEPLAIGVLGGGILVVERGGVLGQGVELLYYTGAAQSQLGKIEGIAQSDSSGSIPPSVKVSPDGGCLVVAAPFIDPTTQQICSRVSKVSLGVANGHVALQTLQSIDLVGAQWMPDPHLAVTIGGDRIVLSLRDRDEGESSRFEIQESTSGSSLQVATELVDSVDCSIITCGGETMTVGRASITEPWKIKRLARS